MLQGIPWEAVVLYTRLIECIDGGLSELAAKVTGIPMPHETEKDVVERILG